MLLAAALRFQGLDWDGGIGAHPDERFMVGVAETLHGREGLNPFEVAPNFAYGHLPVYILTLVGGMTGGEDFLLLARGLVALFDLGIVALTFALGRRVYDERVGTLAAGFVALTVLHVQQAHFYTADVILVFCVMGALLFATRLAEGGRSRDTWLAGAWAGLAVGVKLSAILLVLPLGIACLMACPRGRRTRQRRGLELIGAALGMYILSSPYTLLDFFTFWRNVTIQASIARGTLDVPYTRQFYGSWPYLYPIEQQLRWGMGWLLGIVAFAGLAYAMWRAVREPPRSGEWVLLAWIFPGLAFFGALYAKFPRYLLPFTPLLALCAARFLVDWADRLFPGRSGVGRALGLAAPVFLSSLLGCLAFVQMYRSPHPWLVASDWFYSHAPEGAVVAVEAWDHPLPLNSVGYNVLELPVFSEESPEKRAAIEGMLTQADYVVIASRRGYGTLARWSERYPFMARYYRRLFRGDLAFKPAACFGRHPGLGPIGFVDNPIADLDFSLPEMCQPDKFAFVLSLGRLDESFVVYDHPWVVVFASDNGEIGE